MKCLDRPDAFGWAAVRAPKKRKFFSCILYTIVFKLINVTIGRLKNDVRLLSELPVAVFKPLLKEPAELVAVDSMRW